LGESWDANLITGLLINNILERLLMDEGAQIGSEQIECASTNMR
jgi:hypothetical protein